MEKTTVSKQKERRPGKEKAPARSMVLQRRETMVSYLFLLPALCFFVGLYSSYSFNLPVGASIVLANFVVFCILMVAGKLIRK